MRLGNRIGALAMSVAKQVGALAILVVVGMLAGACGDPDPLGPGAGGSDPDRPVTSAPMSSGDDGNGGDGNGGAQVVEPRPGQSDVHAVGWEKADRKGERRIKVFFWSGVEPCNVLDHVEVEYRKKKIVVTLFEGYDPEAEDQACIEIGVYKAVVVELDEAVGDRRIVDGARRR